MVGRERIALVLVNASIPSSDWLCGVFVPNDAYDLNRSRCRSGDVSVSGARSGARLHLAQMVSELKNSKLSSGGFWSICRRLIRTGIWF